MGNASSLGDLILFPAPASSYNEQLADMVWIHEDFSRFWPKPARATTEQCFPALLLKSPTQTRHTLLYFHGNSCDLGQVKDELVVLSDYLGCNACAVEFPGYGLRRGMQPTSQVIDKWCRAAFEFLVWVGVEPTSILCYGRSIGTGPASKLAMALKREGILVGGVILHAPYTSVHRIVREYSPIGTWFIGNYWDNAGNLRELSPDCPLLIIHGIDDEVIPTTHGRQLLDDYVSDVKDGFFPNDSSHNEYYVVDDLGKPIEIFLKEKSRSRLSAEAILRVPSSFYEAPPSYKANAEKLQASNAASKTAPNGEQEDSTLKSPEDDPIPIEDGFTGALISQSRFEDRFESVLKSAQNVEDIVNSALGVISGSVGGDAVQRH